MKIVIFGLTISSSWGNGHATLWRGLCRALGERGHDVIFFEPGREICIGRSAEDTIATLELGDAELSRIAAAARERVLSEHTAQHRAMELEEILESARCASAAG